MSAVPADLNDPAKMGELDVMDRLGKIEAGLIERDPQIPLHCAQILKVLHTYEELVHLMDDEKIRVLMAGMLTYRRVELVKEAAKTKSKGRGTTVDDI